MMGLKIMNMVGFLMNNVSSKTVLCNKIAIRLMSSGQPNPKKSLPQSTVDQSDVERHSRLKKAWWDPKGPMTALHTYNEIRVPFIRNGLTKPEDYDVTLTPLKGVKILDVGCGGGILAEPLARLGAQVTGIDASKELIDLARSHSENNKRLKNNAPQYICSTVEGHAETVTDYYDGVIASEIIEHVQNPELFVQSCLKTLKGNGRIFITTPNRTTLSRIGVIFLTENVFRLVPRGTHEYDKFITPQELTFLLERSNSDQILYLSAKPVSSVSTLRYKVWHLLELPDYCDEIIVLKTNENVEIPLITLRKGNQPNRPYILEVWPAPRRVNTSTFHTHNNMLTMGPELGTQAECCFDDESDKSKSLTAPVDSYTTTIDSTPPSLQIRSLDSNGLFTSESKKSDVCSCVSNSSSITFKLQGKGSKDAFTNVLIKIQTDLMALSKKLSTLETRIPS